MVLFVIVLAVAAALAISCYFLKLKLTFIAEVSPGDKFARLNLHTAGIQIKTYLLRLQKTEIGFFRAKYYREGILQDIYELKDIIKTISNREKPQRTKEFAEALDMFLDKRKLVIEKLELKIDIGMEDAMASAMLHGAVTSAVNAALCKLYHIKGIPQEPDIRIRPYFDKRLFNLSLNSVLSVRLYIILYSWLKVLAARAREKGLSQIVRDKGGFEKAA